MAESQTTGAYIYEGLWTDWTKGKTNGFTLTLCPDQAVLITSALAVFVTLSGSQLWTIVRFTLHQTKGRPKSTIMSPTQHTKQQLILRNAATDLSTARLMTDLAWSTRRDKKLSARTMAIAVFALFHALLFMVAGTFSNRIISAGSNTDSSLVLIRGNACGIWNQTYYGIAGNGNNPESYETLNLSTQFNMQKAHNVQLSLQYAQECYLKAQDTQSLSSACKTMKVPRLEFTTAEGTCPFDVDICHQGSQGLVIETDVIDSHLHLGINSKASDRLTYQRRTTCAVVNDTNHVTDWDGEIEPGTVNVAKETAYAFYGPVLYKGDNVNFTYSYSNFAALYDNFTNQVSIPYQVGAQMAWAQADPQWSVSDFDPIPELVQDSGDLILFFLSYTGKYLTEVTDPWFCATTRRSTGSPVPLMEELYIRDTAISTLGCVEQHKFCTSAGLCTDYLGFDQVQNNSTFNLALTGNQNATFDRMLRAATETTLGRVVEGLGVTSTPIVAAQALAVGNAVVSLSLPDDQWKLELDFWHSIAMAELQRTIVQWGTGQIAAEAQFLLKPETEQDKWFCGNVAVPSTVYQSFNMVAIILIVAFGTLIITISLNIERIAHLIRRCLGKAAPRKAWDHDDMLKLSNRIRDSFFRPKPPPKDPEHMPPLPMETPTIVVQSPTIRQISHSKSSYTASDEGWKRSSSPTLPMDDMCNAISVSDTSPPRTGELADPWQAIRHDRNSWMAISLNGSDAGVSNAANPPVSSSLQVDSTPEQRARQSSIIRNFDKKGPRQYHLPLNHGTWI